MTRQTPRQAGQHQGRRRFLRQAGQGAAALGLGALPPAVQRALALPPTGRSGGLADINHVVILTQENRSFDHYFGQLRGVRGFGDRFPIPLADGRPVWQQRDARGRELLPWTLDTTQRSGQRVQGTPHTWPDAQAAWAQGRMDGWLDAKTERCMAHYAPADIPFQVALADAFTLCDAYHCALHAGTMPNRLVLWTGHHDPQGRHGGPALVNTFEDLGPADEGYAWLTYPERLQQAGISWQHYQDMADNFADNPVEGFRQFRAARPGSALHRRGLSTRGLDALADDVRRNRLPQVSWVIAPAKASEHPGPSSPLQGAQFTAQVLDALTANPQVWGRTLLLVNFDENDGFFDHVPPPAPPARDAQGRLMGGSTVALAGEYHDARRGPSHGTPDDPPALWGRPYGLGPRVPMTVVSPWSRGGWVCSQVFDHTSVLRLLERRFGVAAPDISPWRRAVCGDLTSALDFSSSPRPVALHLPDTSGADARIQADSRLPPPQPPAPGMPARLPRQQPGLRPSRALPYAVDVVELPTDATTATGPVPAAPGTDHSGHPALRLRFVNRGSAGVVLHVYDLLAPPGQPPRRYTVGAGQALQDDWPQAAEGPLAHHLQVHGSNGFYRAYRTGSASKSAPGNWPTVSSGAGPGEQLRLLIGNPSSQTQPLRLRQAYGQAPAAPLACPPGSSQVDHDPAPQRQWYDLEITHADDPHYLRRLAGRLETGRDGVSDVGLMA